jgi:hypothetical protein
VFFGGEVAQDGAREDPFDEEVLLEDHLFSGLGAHGLEGFDALGVPVVPFDGRDDRLGVGDAAAWSGWREAQSKPSAEPQSWIISTIGSLPTTASRNASR